MAAAVLSMVGNDLLVTDPFLVLMVSIVVLRTMDKASHDKKNVVDFSW
jgi:hypothetical protein